MTIHIQHRPDRFLPRPLAFTILVTSLLCLLACNASIVGTDTNLIHDFQISHRFDQDTSNNNITLSNKTDSSPYVVVSSWNQILSYSFSVCSVHSCITVPFYLVLSLYRVRSLMAAQPDHDYIFLSLLMMKLSDMARSVPMNHCQRMDQLSIIQSLILKKSQHI